MLALDAVYSEVLRRSLNNVRTSDFVHSALQYATCSAAGPLPVSLLTRRRLGKAGSRCRYQNAVTCLRLSRVCCTEPDARAVSLTVLPFWTNLSPSFLMYHTPNRKAAGSSKTFLHAYQSIRRHIPEDGNQNHRRNSFASL